MNKRAVLNNMAKSTFTVTILFIILWLFIFIFFNFFVSATSVSACSILSTADTTYTLTQNVSANGTCFTITSNNITLEGAGYNIIYGINGTGSSYGVYVNGANTSIIKNLKIEEGNQTSLSGRYNIYLNIVNNATINNNTLTINSSSGSNAIDFDQVNDSIISDNIINVFGSGAFGIDSDSSSNGNNITGNNITSTVSGSTQIAIAGDYNIISWNNLTSNVNNAEGINIGAGANYNNFSYNRIRTYNSNSNGILFGGASNSNLFNFIDIITNSSNSNGFSFLSGNINASIFDSTINASLSSSNDTQFASTSSGIVNFTNVTLANNKIGFVGATKTLLNVYWYLDTQVNDSSNVVVQNANVSAYNASGGLAFSVLTDANGFIPRQTLFSYSRNGTNLYDSNNFTINVSKSGFISSSQSWNMTVSRNIFFTLNAPPFINFTAPTLSNGSLTTTTSVEINASIIETDNDLSEVKFNWNGTNYTYYDNSLYALVNFENYSALGENDTHVKDFSIYGNNGTVQGGISWSATRGKYGGAYDFVNANNYIAVRGAGLPSTPSLYTLEAWVYFNSYADGFGMIWSRNNNTGNVIFNLLGVRNSSGRLDVSHNNNLVATTGISVSTGVWNHYIARYNSSTFSLFIDGVERYKEVTGAITLPTTCAILLGIDSDSGCAGSFGSDDLNGSIDNFMFYNRSLSDDEIRQHYFMNLYKYNSSNWVLYVNQSKNSTNGLDNGNYTYFVSAKDNTGDENVTQIRSVQVAVDTTPPKVTINQPTPAFVNLSTSSVNFNVTTDENADTAIYTLNNGITNITMTRNGNRDFNATNTSIKDGTYQVNYYVNDTVGNKNYTQSRNFTIDTTFPLISIKIPLNQSYNSIQTEINFTASDLHLSNCWYSTDLGVTNTSVSCNGNVSGLNSGQGGTRWKAYVNDTARNINTSTISFFVDSIFPLVSYGTGTSGDYTNQTATSIYVNVSVTETNEANITFTLHNSTKQVNSTTFTTAVRTINWTALPGDTYKYNVTVVDTVSNINTTATRTLTVDTTPPRVTINQPTPAFVNLSTSSVNFNVTTDENADTAIYTLNNGITNITMTRNGNRDFNATNTSIKDGTYQVNYYVNDTVGNKNYTQSRNFTIDTTLPSSITFVSPTETDALNLSRSNIIVNVTATDSGTGVSTILIRLYNSTHNQINSSLSASSPNYINFTGLSNGIYYFNATVNDSVNNVNNTSTRTVQIDTTYPLVSFGVNSEGDGTNQTRTNIYLNASVTETNEDSITFLLHNATARVNSTTFTNKAREINWTGLADGTYRFNVTVNDSAGNTNTSVTRTVTIDNVAPVVTIVFPTESQEFSVNTSIGLNFTVVDTGADANTCWYNLDHTANTTLTNCANTTFNTSDGSHTLYLFANDSLGHVSSDSNAFSISLTAPAITLNYPPNATFFNTRNNIYLNYTATDTNGIGVCQVWHDLNGTFSRNQTNTGVTSGQQNFSVFNISADKLYHWNIFCNDTSNNGRFSADNFTFTIDTISPTISVTTIATTTGSQTFSFNFTVNDTNLHSCYYSILNNTGGIDGNNENISVTCGANNTQDTVSAFSTFNLTIYANDTAGNINSASKSFTTTQSAGGGTGGGGGGGPISPVIIEKVSVVAIKSSPNDKKQLDIVKRAILYTQISKLCIEISTSRGCFPSVQQLSTLQFVLAQPQPQKSGLSEKELSDLQAILKKHQIDLTIEELLSWIDSFNKQDLESVEVDRQTADALDLSKAIVKVVAGDFKVNPENIDSFYWLVIGNRFDTRVESNKKVSSASIVEGELGFSLNISEEKTSVTLSYILQEEPKFSFKLLTARANYISEDGESVFQNINIRAINPNFKTGIGGLPLYIVIIISATLLVTIFVFRKNILRTIGIILRTIGIKRRKT